MNYSVLKTGLRAKFHSAVAALRRFDETMEIHAAVGQIAGHQLGEKIQDNIEVNERDARQQYQLITAQGIRASMMPPASNIFLTQDQIAAKKLVFARKVVEAYNTGVAARHGLPMLVLADDFVPMQREPGRQQQARGLDYLMGTQSIDGPTG